MNKGPSVRRIVVVAVALVIVAGCGGDGEDAVPATGVPRMATSEPTAAAPAAQPAGDVAYSVLVDAAVADIEAFWAEAYPAVFGDEFEPVTEVVGYRPSEPESLPTCYGAPAPPDNAFYCDETDFIGFDDEGLFPGTYEALGDIAVATILAHEYGHAIQWRIDVLDNPTFLVEQQADCLAGAWVASVDERNGTGGLRVTAEDLRQAVAANLRIADPIGLRRLMPGAHGTGFDRIRAFSEGYDGGVAVCSAYVARPPIGIELPYELTPTGPASEPLITLMAEVTSSFVAFWGFVFPDLDLPTITDDDPGCAPPGVLEEGGAVWCVETNTVHYDSDAQQELWDEIGDAGAVHPLVHAWTQAVVAHMRAVDDPAAVVTGADCLAGVWYRRLADEHQRVLDAGGAPRYAYHPAAGDLDEILDALLSAPVTGPDGADLSDVSPFARTAAFGDGFLEGEGSCELG